VVAAVDVQYGGAGHFEGEQTQKQAGKSKHEIDAFGYRECGMREL